ncbi:hypothetical protein HPP92_001488 [Vanilla planifolia]|uniref:RING-type E3 ubiquitin transferase n=1 Tax=Vanilla planifolia TaxID=51239 RepID=A0A835S3F9_VANPL|nr:hypothetical protein HPP92_001488 [Vanilla planifolia]
MATGPSSPPPVAPLSPPLEISFSKQNHYYIIIVGLPLTASLILLTNAFAMGFFPRLWQLLWVPSAPTEVDSYVEVQLWLPARTHRRRDEEEGEVECAVCLSLFNERDDVSELPQCGHLFHASCIDLWFQSRGSCPVCRSIVLPTPSHSIDISHQHSSDGLLRTRAGIGI